MQLKRKELEPLDVDALYLTLMEVGALPDGHVESFRKLTQLYNVIRRELLATARPGRQPKQTPRMFLAMLKVVSCLTFACPSGESWPKAGRCEGSATTVT